MFKRNQTECIILFLSSIGFGATYWQSKLLLLFSFQLSGLLQQPSVIHSNSFYKSNSKFWIDYYFLNFSVIVSNFPHLCVRSASLAWQASSIPSSSSCRNPCSFPIETMHHKRKCEFLLVKIRTNKCFFSPPTSFFGTASLLYKFVVRNISLWTKTCFEVYAI